jgi:hypothetical protein
VSRESLYKDEKGFEPKLYSIQPKTLSKIALFKPHRSELETTLRTVLEDNSNAIFKQVQKLNKKMDRIANVQKICLDDDQKNVINSVA